MNIVVLRKKKFLDHITSNVFERESCNITICNFSVNIGKSNQLVEIYAIILIK